MLTHASSPTTAGTNARLHRIAVTVERISRPEDATRADTETTPYAPAVFRAILSSETPVDIRALVADEDDPEETAYEWAEEILVHNLDAIDLRRLEPGASGINFLDGHYGEPIGKVTNPQLTERGLEADITISRADFAGNKLIYKLAEGIDRQISVGFSVKEMVERREADGVLRIYITRWTLDEVSSVSTGADRTAQILERKRGANLITREQDAERAAYRRSVIKAAPLVRGDKTRYTEPTESTNRQHEETSMPETTQQTAAAEPTPAPAITVRAASEDEINARVRAAVTEERDRAEEVRAAIAVNTRIRNNMKAPSEVLAECESLDQEYRERSTTDNPLSMIGYNQRHEGILNKYSTEEPIKAARTIDEQHKSDPRNAWTAERIVADGIKHRGAERGLAHEVKKEFVANGRESWLAADSTDIIIPSVCFKRAARLGGEGAHTRAAISSSATEISDGVGGTITSNPGTALQVQEFRGDLYVPLDRPGLVLNPAGMSRITVANNITIPIKDTHSAWRFYGEGEQIDTSSLTFSSRTTHPHRMGCFVPITREREILDRLAIRSLAIEDIMTEMDIAREVGLLTGNAASNSKEVNGILNTPGIGIVSAGANGGAITRKLMTSIWREFQERNVGVSPVAVVTPGIEESAKNRPYGLDNAPTDRGLASAPLGRGGAGGSMRAGINGTIADVPYYCSTLLPTNGTKGTHTAADLHSMIVGDFSQVLDTEYDMVRLIIDSVTGAGGDIVKLIANFYFDMIVRNLRHLLLVRDINIAA